MVFILFFDLFLGMVPYNNNNNNDDDNNMLEVDYLSYKNDSMKHSVR